MSQSSVTMDIRKMSTPKLHVEVDANVVWQLGEELITDAEQALLELIKNCYDADAQVARVSVNTEDKYEVFPGKNSLQGCIVVEDDGTGMDLATIEHGWLTISLSMKKAFKAAGKKTRRFHRTPLGDKGLGRLGTMKLGDTIEIVTHATEGAQGYRVRLSWSEFASGKVLSKVPIQVDTVEPVKRTGTRLTIYGLHEPQYWRGADRHNRLADSMSSLLSPFQRFSNFRIAVEVDGNRVELHEIGEDVRKGATVRCSFAWTGKTLQCEAHLKRSLFKGSTKDDDEYARYVEADDGAAFLKFLKADDKVRGLLTKSPKGPWFITVTEEIAKEDVLVGGAEDPGPFTGEIDSFELDSADAAELFSTTSEYRQYVKRFAGVSVYRDHFAIRMEEDWLRLGQSWTSGLSYYSLKPANTIGYFEISALHNPQLREKSDREGFLDTRASQGFFTLTRQCVAFANATLTDVRRAFGRYKEERVNADAKLPSAWAPPDAIKALKTARASARAVQENLAATDRKRKSAVVRVRDSLRRLMDQGDLPAPQRKVTSEALKQVEEVVDDYEKKRADLDAQLALLHEDHALTTSILQKFDDFKNQVTEVYEAVALGLAAESLAHEVSAILDDLVQRTNRVAPKAKRLGDPAVLGYIESVRAVVSSLRKQVSFLDPMLRATREQKSVFSVGEFTKEFIELRTEHLTRVGVVVTIDVQKDFTVRMSRGRLQQVFDNLCRNSEFWLAQQAGDATSKGTITFSISAPNVVVSDSGPGVKPSVENALFEPFISGKPGGQGRGLGLFISRQLLRRDGCDITLDLNRNSKGRRYQFVVNLQAVEQT